MSNPLKDLTKIFTPTKEKTILGTITQITNSYLLCTTENNLVYKVWGTADIGDKVVIKGNQIMGKIGSVSIRTVQVI